MVHYGRGVMVVFTVVGMTKVVVHHQFNFQEHNGLVSEDLGGYGFIATKDDGTTWVWGNNTNAELGLNDKDSFITTSTSWNKLACS